MSSSGPGAFCFGKSLNIDSISLIIGVFRFSIRLTYFYLNCYENIRTIQITENKNKMKHSHD